MSKWGKDVDVFEQGQWEEALQAVQTCSLNVTLQLYQLYIVLQVHFTPARLCKMGVRDDSVCTRCSRDHGDLIHLLWRYPKLHLYCTRGTINKVNIPTDPKPCLLGILDELPIEKLLNRLLPGLSSRPINKFFSTGKQPTLLHLKSGSPRLEIPYLCKCISSKTGDVNSTNYRAHGWIHQGFPQ